MIIDTDVWVTQQALANELKMSIQGVHNWVQRHRIETLQYPNSKLILVKKGSETINKNHYKHRGNDNKIQ